MNASPSRLLAQIVDPVRRLCAEAMPEPERWSDDVPPLGPVASNR